MAINAVEGELFTHPISSNWLVGGANKPITQLICVLSCISGATLIVSWSGEIFIQGSGDPIDIAKDLPNHLITHP